MIHLITLSGNSKRFIHQGYTHKALCDINGYSVIETFIKSFTDFNKYQSIFLCRQDDLDHTELNNEIKKHSNNAVVYGIKQNNLGPVYSIQKIFNQLPNNQKILISYIDAPQKTSISNLLDCFSGYDGGITVHNFQNPHWRTNCDYCLVEYNEKLEVCQVAEKHKFTDKDFSHPRKGGSNGSYYFHSIKLMKKYFTHLLNNNIRVNNEFYITQALEYMIKDNLKVKAYHCPYASLGTPADLEDYAFWMRWFNDFNSTSR